MICPFCQNPSTKVVDSRVLGESIRRRRGCEGCGKRFSTMERVDRRMPQVVKKDGTRQPYDSQKVSSGLELACRKRPVSSDQLDHALVRIEAQVFAEAEKGEIRSQRVGELVLEELGKLDRVAFLRFASVYQEFNTPEQFLELIQPLLKDRS